MKINLWNVYHLNKNKTRNVIEYINDLKLPQETTSLVSKKFEEIKREALSKTTPDEMLERVGYNLRGVDKIFEEVIGK